MTAKTAATLLTELAADFPDNTAGFITPADFRAFMTDFINSVITLLDVDQSVAGGGNITSTSLGSVAGGILVFDCGKCPLQYLTNNGPFTLSAPAVDGSAILLVTNGGTAGTITFTGFTVGGSTGDAMGTTPGNLFSISIWRINGISGYRIAAHQ